MRASFAQLSPLGTSFLCISHTRMDSAQLYVQDKWHQIECILW